MHRSAIPRSAIPRSAIPRSAILAATLAVTALVTRPVAADDPETLIRSALGLACEAPSAGRLKALATRLAGVRNARVWVRHSGREATGWRLDLALAEGRLMLDGDGPVGRPERVEASYRPGAEREATVVAEAGHACRLLMMRRMVAEAGGPDWVETVDAVNGQVVDRQPLNPAVPTRAEAGLGPEAKPAGGPVTVPVAVVDTGINYLQPDVLARVARGPDGDALGYDFQDLDDRPFDVPTHDALSDHHHGTLVATLILREAPVARIVPYRYPHQAMDRMGALVEDAAAQGLRIVNLSLASPDRQAWLPLAIAARRHREMLFVIAAGNHDRNIEERLVYPAAFRQPNFLVVTAATADGQLAAGANWGPKTVHLMVPGADLAVLGFDGRTQRVSGSSFATARVSAFAACLLAAHPDWRAAELKAAVLQAAEPRPAWVAHGFIGDRQLGTCAERQIAGALPGPDRF